MLHALDVFIEYSSPSMLAVRDIGSIAVVSTTFKGVANNAFERLFRHIAPLECEVTPSSRTWDKEKGALPCFAKPPPSVIAGCGGWGTACKCLLIPRCAFCGAGSNTANPLTLVRNCKECAKTEELACGVVKAKEHFLLAPKDIAPLRTAHVPAVPWFGRALKDGQTTPMLLMIDVGTAALQKWGSADALATQIASKKAAAHARYDKSQGTAKPQKKRPKIQHLTERPFDEQKLISSHYGNAVPIGSVAWSEQHKAWQYQHGCTCKSCDVTGTMVDVSEHYYLRHRDQMPERFPSRKPPRMFAITPAQPELTACLASGSAQHYGSNSAAFDQFGNYVDQARRRGGVYTFKGCTVSVDFEGMTPPRQFAEYGYGLACDTGATRWTIEICAEIGRAAAVVLAKMNQSGVVRREATPRHFDALASALGLERTSAAELIAALMARTFDIHVENPELPMCPRATGDAMLCADEQCDHCPKPSHLAAALNMLWMANGLRENVTVSEEASKEVMPGLIPITDHGETG